MAIANRSGSRAAVAVRRGASGIDSATNSVAGFLIADAKAIMIHGSAEHIG